MTNAKGTLVVIASSENQREGTKECFFYSRPSSSLSLPPLDLQRPKLSLGSTPSTAPSVMTPRTPKEYVLSYSFLKREDMNTRQLSLWLSTMYAHCAISGNYQSYERERTFPVGVKTTLCSLHVGHLKFPGDDGEYQVTARDLEYVQNRHIGCFFLTNKNKSRNDQSIGASLHFMVIPILKTTALIALTTGARAIIENIYFTCFFPERTLKSAVAITGRCTKWSIAKRREKWLSRHVSFLITFVYFWTSILCARTGPNEKWLILIRNASRRSSEYMSPFWWFTRSLQWDWSGYNSFHPRRIMCRW